MEWNFITVCHLLEENKKAKYEQDSDDIVLFT